MRSICDWDVTVHAEGSEKHTYSCDPLAHQAFYQFCYSAVEVGNSKNSGNHLPDTTLFEMQCLNATGAEWFSKLTLTSNSMRFFLIYMKLKAILLYTGSQQIKKQDKTSRWSLIQESLTLSANGKGEGDQVYDSVESLKKPEDVHADVEEAVIDFKEENTQKKETNDKLKGDNNKRSLYIFHSFLRDGEIFIDQWTQVDSKDGQLEKYVPISVSPMSKLAFYQFSKLQHYSMHSTRIEEYECKWHELENHPSCFNLKLIKKNWDEANLFVLVWCDNETQRPVFEFTSEFMITLDLGTGHLWKLGSAQMLWLCCASEEVT